MYFDLAVSKDRSGNGERFRPISWYQLICIWCSSFARSLWLWWAVSPDQLICIWCSSFARSLCRWWAVSPDQLICIWSSSFERSFWRWWAVSPDQLSESQPARLDPSTPSDTGPGKDGVNLIKNWYKDTKKTTKWVIGLGDYWLGCG